MVRIDDKEYEKLNRIKDEFTKLISEYNNSVATLDGRKVIASSEPVENVRAIISADLTKYKKMHDATVSWKDIMEQKTPNAFLSEVSDVYGGRPSASTLDSMMGEVKSYKEMNTKKYALKSLAEDYKNHVYSESKSENVQLTKSTSILEKIAKSIEENKSYLTVEAVKDTAAIVENHYKQTSTEVVNGIGSLNASTNLNLFVSLDSALLYDSSVRTVLGKAGIKLEDNRIKNAVALKATQYLAEEARPELNILEHISKKTELSEDDKFYARNAIDSVGIKCKRMGNYINPEDAKVALLKNYTILVEMYKK